MVHFPAVVRYSRPASHAGDVGGSPAASAALPPHSNVPDAWSAHVGRGRTGRLHYGAKDSHAYRSVHPYGDSGYGGWGHGNNNSQYQRFELGLGNISAVDMLPRCATSQNLAGSRCFGFRCCGKIPSVSFRGRGLPEESAFFLGLVKKQIPRFARDDIRLLFSAAASAATLKRPNIGL